MAKKEKKAKKIPQKDRVVTEKIGNKSRILTAEETDKILKRYPHLKKHGEEKSSKKAADSQKG